MGAIRPHKLDSKLSPEENRKEALLDSLEYSYPSYYFCVKQVSGESGYRVSMIASTCGSRKAKQDVAESFGNTLAEARDMMIHKMNKLLDRLREGNPKLTHYIQK